MKIAICSKYDKERIAKTLRKKGFEVVKKKPDLVISYGGDGTVLYSEKEYPEVPKLIIKTNSRIFRDYEYKPRGIRKILDKIKKGEYSLVERMKIRAKYKNEVIEALNEIQVRLKSPTKAIRFSLKIGDKNFEKLTGDGIIIATPFGSTGYYNSVGGKPFEKGIGLAFNNIHLRTIGSKILSNKIKIKVKIDRGPALLIKDNSEKLIELKDGEKVIVRKSNNKAKFIKIK